MTHRVILSDAVYEAVETLDGKLLETDGGFWECQREIELPVEPYRGLVLATDRDEAGEPVYFRIKRVVWDVTQNAWLAYGDFSVLIPHESTPEAIKARFPDWEMRWIDNHCFDEEGNLLPERSE